MFMISQSVRRSRAWRKVSESGNMGGEDTFNESKKDRRKIQSPENEKIASILALGVGNVLAWSSPVFDMLKKEDSFLKLTLTEESWIGSLLAIGAIVGALPAGKIADIIGRKRCILSLAAPFLLSWTIILFANSAIILCIARFIAGIGVGASCVLVPTYISEIAEASARGTLGSIFQLFLTAGIVFSFVFGTILSYTGFTIVCAMVEIVFLACFFWMPESPVWLVGKSRNPEATIAMTILRGDVYDQSSELNSIQRECEESSSRKSSIFDLIGTVAARRATLASLSVMIFQQLSGINAVIFYTSQIFTDAGSDMDSGLASILVALVQLIMAAVAAVIVDKAGRKPLLMVSCAGCGLSLIAIGVYFFLKDAGNDVSSLGWIPLSSLVIFMIAFSIGLGPISWMLMGELYTVDLRGTATSLAVMVNWLLVFLVTRTFPDMSKALGSATTFWIFAGVMIGATIFTFFFIPETKGKSTEDIQNKLNGIRRARPT